MAFKLLSEEIVKDNLPGCKGLTFRGYSSTFISHRSRRIERREGVALLKNSSCPGCEKCDWMLDDMSEHIACETLNLPEIEHGTLYSLKVANISRDSESGIIDDFDLEFYKIKEDKK